MRARVTVDDAAFARQSEDLHGRLVKAQQAAVNATGKRVLDGLRVAMEEKLDRPNQFTLNAFSLLRARGRHTDAAIAVNPIQYGYLRHVFAGGVRSDDVIPSKAARLDRHGNMPRFYTRGIVSTGQGFWRTAKSGVRTLFVRQPGGGLAAVAFRVKRTSYKPVFDPVQEARALVADILPDEAEKAFKSLSGDE